MSFHEVQAMTAMGMPGVSTWNFGEAFSSSLSRFGGHESQQHRPRLRDLGKRHGGNHCSAPFPRAATPWNGIALPPPSADVVWSARDNLNYQETGALAALDTPPRNPKRCSAISTERAGTPGSKGLDQPPYAFLIPRTRAIPLASRRWSARLIAQHIEVVTRARLPSESEGGELSRRHLRGAARPAVSQLRRGSAHAAELSPKDGERAYDDVSWELPAHYHLQAIPTADPSVRSGLTPLKEAPHPAGNVPAPGQYYMLKDTGQEGLLAARYRLADFEIEIAEHPFECRRTQFPAGSWILACARRTAARCAQRPELGLDFTSVAAAPEVPRHRPKRRGSASGCLGRIQIPSAGSAIRSISAKFLTPTCAMKTSVPERFAITSMC